MYSVVTSDLCLSSRRRYTGGKTEEQWWIFSLQTAGHIMIKHIIFYHIILWYWSDCFCVQRCGSGVSMAAEAETAAREPVKRKEAWSESNPPRLPSSGPSPDHKPSVSPPSKPIRTKQTHPSPVAPPPLVPPPQHCIQGTLRHADFQHNGELQPRN